MTRLLVFGKTGQVATALRNRVNTGTPSIEIDCAGRNEVDITDADAVSRLLQKNRPSYVVNAAAYTAVDQAETESELALAVNCTGAETIARAAQALEIPIIHLSTDYVFSGSKNSPYLETDETNPTSQYGMSKLCGEQAVISMAERHIILRTAWVYSETGSNFVKTMLRLASERNSINVVCDQIGNPTSANEISEGIIHVVEHLEQHQEFDEWGVFHFCGIAEKSWAEFAEDVLALSDIHGGNTASIVKVTSAEYKTPVKRPENSRLNTNKFNEVFGFQHFDYNEALEKVVKSIIERQAGQ